MNPIQTIDGILDAFPSLAWLAGRIGETPDTVRMWKYRRSIPAVYDLSVIEAARTAGIDLSLEDLARARRRKVESVQ